MNTHRAYRVLAVSISGENYTHDSGSYFRRGDRDW